MTRTFAAVFPPLETRERLSELIEKLRELSSGVKWVETASLHLTMRFFGELADEQIQIAAQCMNDISELESSFGVRLSALGAFPSVSRARVIWVGVEEGREKLTSIAKALEESFVRAGLGTADKPFSPHLTIGRVKIPRKSPELEEAIRSLTFEGGEFIIDTLTLTKSELRPGGPIYSPLSVAELKRTE